MEVQHQESEISTELQKAIQSFRLAGEANNSHKHELSAEAKEALTSVKMAKLRKRLNAESWNDNLESLMKKWGEKAAGHRFMHDHAASTWRSFSDKLTFTSIIITTIASSMSLVASSVEDPDSKNVVLYIVGGVGMFSSLIQSLKKFWDAEQKAANHNSVARQFGSFYRYMVLQLNLTREDRQSSDQLSEYVLKEYERLQQEAPSIGPKQVELYRKTFKDANQAVPDICEKDFNIHVYSETPKTVEVECKLKENDNSSKKPIVNRENNVSRASELDSQIEIEIGSNSNSSNY